ncbi:MAG: hypothetical protein ABI239_11135 [Aquihabitans sp.]
MDVVHPSLDGRRFADQTGRHDGDVSGDTVFAYREADGEIWADYAGGVIRRGSLVGSRSGNRLDFRYVHLTADGETASGRCQTMITALPDGRLRLEETWAWESRSGAGTSTLEELPPITG